jgi:hypothetical protein
MKIKKGIWSGHLICFRNISTLSATRSSHRIARIAVKGIISALRKKI